MRILYGIQGTGHGHISRAREILPRLHEYAEIDILISGYNCKMEILDFHVIRKRGISFEYNSRGSVSILDTALGINPVRFLKDVQSLPVNDYDLIISDYEPITAWASFASRTKCIGMSHQASFLSDKSPRPPKPSLVAEQVLKHFVPCNDPVGFHFRRYDTFIEPPVIRTQVLDLNPVPGDHITVYLPAFDHETLMSIFHDIKDVRWEIFSPFCEEPYTKGHMRIAPVGNEPFLESLEGSLGVITSAGFETCAESMYLGKKLMALPIKNQYEQLCNAAALKEMGVPVLSNLGPAVHQTIKKWILEESAVPLPEIADIGAVTKKLIQFAKQEKHQSSPVT